MKNFKNRAIAFLLAFAMVATTMFSDVSMISADDTVVTSTEEAVASNEEAAPAAAATEDAAPSNEEAAPTETTGEATPVTTTEEAAQAETTQTETTDEAAPVTTTDEAAPVTTTETTPAATTETTPAATTETTPAATETPAVTETPAAAPTETPAAATYTQAVSGSSSYNGVTVTVNAPVGAFQDGTTLAITPIESSSVNSAVAGAMGEDFSGAVAFDITFFCNGVEVQPVPGYNVDVNFTVTPASSIVDSSAETQDIKVFHLESEGSAAQQINAVTDVPVDATALVDSAANSFSIYVVATTTKARATYKFYNGSTEVGSQVVKAGDTVILPTSPSEEGAVFTGWYDTADGTDGKLISTTVSNVTAGTTYKWYAHFETAHYVYYKESAAANARTLFSEKVIAGSEVPLDKTFEVKTDKALIGWSTDPNATEALTEYTMGTSDVNLYPVIKEAHWLTFNSEGGTSVDPVSVINGSAPVKPSDPTKTGYSFGGWYTDESCSDSNAFNWESTLTENTILYAKWTPATANYTVVYWQESLTPGADGSIQYDYISSSSQSGTTGSNANISTFETAVYGFHYASYATNNTSDTTALTIAADGTTVINLYYNRNSYTFEFSLPGENGIDGYYTVPEKALNQAVLTIGNQNYTYNGTKYSFTAKFGEDISDKWPTASNISGSYEDTYWSRGKQHTDTYNLTNLLLGWRGGSYTGVHGSKRYNVTSELILSDEDGATQSFKGVWATQAKQYTLYYYGQNANDDGYSEIKAYTQTVNALGTYGAKEIAGFTNISKTPSGYPTSSGNTCYFYYNRTSSNLNLYNIANETSTSIRYGKNIYSNLSATVAAPSGKSGFTFGGWYTTVDCKDGSEYSYNENTTMPAGNLDLYAKWVAPTISVTFNLNGGSNELGDYSKKEIPYGTTATKPVNPVREHYEFAGWTRDGVAFNFESTALTADTVLVAKWIGLGHENITYNANAVSGTTVTGSVPTDNTLYRNTASAKVLSNGELSISGYAFICWNTQADGEGTDYYPGSLVSFENGSVILYAKWESTKNTTSVTYDYNGGTDTNNNGTSTIDTIVNNDVAVPTIDSLGVTKKGYYFTGWRTKKGENVTDGNYFADSINPDENVLIAQWCKKDAVTFTGESGTEVYNGSEQSLTGITPTGLLSGHTYDGLTYRASGTNVGTYDGAFTGTVVIRDANGENVTNHYEITYNPGTLTISKAEIAVEFKGESGEKTYNGSTQSLTGITPTGLLSGHTYEGLTYSASGKNVGTYDGTFSGTAVIKDADGTDVTQNYVVTTTPGTLTISKAEIAVEFKGESGEKTYNGSTQSLTGITPTGLLSGHTYEGLTYSASGKNVGTYDGTFSGTVVIKDADGTDVTQNYVVTTTPGTLTISKAEIAVEFKGESGEKTYNGSTQSLTGITPTGLLSGHTYEGLTYSASGKNVGTYDGTFSGTAVIKDADGTDVTQNYVVTTTPGTLTISKAEIAVEFKGESGEKTYNGSTQSLTGITPTGLLSGHTYEGLTYSASGKNVGTYDGTFSGTAVIKDADGTDVTQNYKVTTTPGTLKITQGKINVIFKGESKKLPYSNTKQEINGITPTGLLSGHTYEGLTYSASGKNVGTYYGTFSGTVVIKDADGTDVTQNYAIEEEPGTLEITKLSIPVTFKGESGEKTYNGSTQSLTGITPTGLLSGHTYEGLTYSASGKNVGTYDGTFSGTAVIKDADGTDVTQNYVVTTTPGTLTISKAEIAVEFKGESGEKTYNGSTQSLTGITPTGLLSGHTYEGLTYSASGKNVGTYDGTFSGTAVIKDADGTDVTQNYVVTTTPGTLTISKAEIAVEFKGESGEKTYNGSTQSLTGITPTGLLSGHTYEGLTYSASGKNVGTYDGTFSGTAVIKDADGTDVTQNYVVTTTPGTLTISKAEIAVEFKGESGEKTYNGSTQSLTGITPTGLLSGHTYEGLTYSASGKNVGTYDGTFSGTAVIKDADGTDVTQNYVVTTTPGTLTISKAEIAVEFKGESGEKTYNGSTQSLTGITPTGLLSGHTYEGLTYSASGKNVGTYDGTFSGTAVIKDADGTDVTQNYVVTTTPGTLTISKAEIAVEFKGESGEKTYNGSTQSLTGITPTGLLSGHTYEGLTYSASGKNVGTYDGTFSGTAVIKDADGTDVTQNYKVTTTPGTLKITQGKINVIFKGESKKLPYSNTKQEINGITPTGLLSGHTYEGLTYSASGKNVGTYYGTFSGTVVIKDADGTDVTQNYAIEEEPGTLEITKLSIPVTFKGESGEKTYNGSTQSLTGITPTGLLSGHTYEGLTYSASGKNVGTYDGTFSGTVVIKDADGTDVTQNYVVTTTPGTLTISKAEIAVEFKGESGEKTYNGSTQSLTGITPTGLLSGHTYEGLTYSASGKNVGTYDGTFSGTAVIKDADGTDVTQNYVVTTTPGTLTISKAEIAVEFKGESGEKTYNGSTQSLTGITPTGLLSGHTYEGLTYSASGKNVGTYDGTFSGTAVIKDADGTDVTQNYVVTTTPGTLTISKAEIAVEFKGESGEKTYNGSTQSLTGITPTGLLSGHTYEGLTYSASGKNVGTYDGTFSGTAVIKDADGTDVTQNYVVTTTPGTLTISKAEIAVEFKGESGEKTYNGSTQSLTGITPTGLLSGHTYEGLTYSASGKNVGTYDGTFSGTAVIKDADGTDVTQNYKVTTTPGIINIKSLKVIVKANDKIKYAGSSGPTLDATVTGLIGTDTVIYKVTREKGESIGTYKITPSGATDQGNYIVTYETGTFTINAIPFVAAPSMSTAKTITNTPANGTAFAAGETVNFSIEVKNTGNVDLTNVKVTDALTGLDTTIPVVAVGKTETVTTSYTVTQADIDSRATLTNTATVTPNDPGVTPQNPQIIIPIATPTASIASVKTITSTPANGVAYAAGETVTFAITVTNTGNTTQNNVTVTDALTGLNTTIATIPVGQSATVTTSYTVTAADVAAGTLSNTAVVTPGPDPTNPNPTPQNPTVIIPIAPPIVPATPVVPPVVPTAPTTTTTTTTTTTDTTTTVAPAPAATAPTASVGTTTVTVPDTKVPLADGGLKYTLTAIGDNTVPLASGTNEHKCCILHFLLLLAALVVEIFYIRSAKKHQKRIHELRRQIADEKQKLELINDRNAENQQVG